MTGVCRLGHVRACAFGRGGWVVVVDIARGNKHLWSVGRGGSGGRK